MHSSRMRTARCSGRGLSVRGGVSRVVWVQGVSAHGDLPRGCVSRAGGVDLGYVSRACGSRGDMCVPGDVLGCPGVYPSMQWGRHPPPRPLWTEFLTHACENITFPQLLLWTVKIRPADDN